MVISRLRKICCFTLLLGLSLLARGQDPAGAKTLPSGDMIARWLHSGDPREAAWAAVFVLEENDDSFLPEFASLAEQWQPLPHRNVLEHEYHPAPTLTPEERERRDAMTALLDAVIQLNGSLPAASLQNLVDDFPAQALILLRRMPPEEAESTLLQIYGETAPASWYTQRTAAAMLALRPPAGFAASLLTNLTVTSHVRVSLPEDPGMGGGTTGDCWTNGQPPVKTNWPSIGKYFLRESEPGGTPAPYLTIPGLRPIDAVRVVSPTLETDSAECTGFTPLNNAIRVTLLAQMLGVQSEQIAISSDVDVNLRVKNEQDYEAQLTAYVDREEAKFRAVKRDLLAKQLLSPAETADDAVLPSLLLVVRDDRSAKDFPLGQVIFRLPKVKWEAERLGVIYE